MFHTVVQRGFSEVAGGYSLVWI